MFPFFFQFDVRPVADVEALEDIQGAVAHVWVVSLSKDDAHMDAVQYLTDYGWEIQSLDIGLRILSEQLPHLNKQEEKLYRTALKHGIAADILGWKNDKPIVDFEIRPLKQVD